MNDETISCRLSVDEAQARLTELVGRVGRQSERVEITDNGSADKCVLISRRELENLERAIELLSDRDEVRSVADSLARCLAADAAKAGVGAAA
jgi:prevent-host-death family protein